MTIIEQLLKERKNKVNNSLYRQMQILMAYHSNKIEGSTCTLEETRLIFDTSSYGVQNPSNDIIETFNHFRAFDVMLDTYKQKLTEEYIKGLHKILKFNTTDIEKGFMIGEYKTSPNYVGKITTSIPENVPYDMSTLLNAYQELPNKELRDILRFHVRFEEIHPFQDGNGRIGRLIMIKECFCHKVPPFIISSKNNLSYKAFLMGCQLKMENADNKFIGFIQREQKSFESMTKEILTQTKGR